jgi:hypothetical protein
MTYWKSSFQKRSAAGKEIGKWKLETGKTKAATPFSIFPFPFSFR